MLKAGEHDNGATIALAIHEELELALPENRTAGFRWQIVADVAAVCALIEDAFEQPSSLVGAPGLHRWRFRAIGPGPSPISLEYRRSWEGSQQARRFSLTVVVR